MPTPDPSSVSPAGPLLLRLSLEPVFLLVASVAHWLVGDGAYAARSSSAWVPPA